PFGYYRSKFAVERLIEDSGVDWTVLRATQFHDLLLQLFQGLSKVPVMLLPARVKDQPVDVGEVADRLCELAQAAPAGRVEDMGGPEVRTLHSLARSYLEATGRRRAVVKVPLRGAAYQAFRAGGHLAPDHAVGTRTFEEFLARRRQGARAQRWAVPLKGAAYRAFRAGGHLAPDHAVGTRTFEEFLARRRQEARAHR